MEKIKINKVIFLNAGHWDKDPGAIYGGTTEAQETKKIRDLLVPLLKPIFKVYVVPDDLDLNNSIKWVNQYAKDINDGLAFSIHLNAGGGTGAEALYYGGSNESKQIAQTILDEYCKRTGFKNRGAKSDTTTRLKRNGWIRDTNCWSTLLECYFLDNEKDRGMADNNDIADAIFQSICKLFGVDSDVILVSKKTLEKLGDIKNQLLDIAEDLDNLVESIPC